jgi:glycosyltransferase involved in cell wall biosynthesis
MVPRVSVVIPAYGVAPYIAETLESVFAQTFEAREVIVVNDGSPDTPALEAALAPWRNRIVYHTQPNGGASAARNAGIRLARGEYIGFLDGDDRWEPTALADHVAALDADPSLGLRFANGTFFGQSHLAGREMMSVCPVEGDIALIPLLRGVCSVFIGGVARKVAIEEAGLFDPSVRTSEDFDLWVRLLGKGWRIGYTRQRLFASRIRSGSLSSDRTRMERSALQVFEKIGKTAPLTPEERAVLEEETRRRHAVLALETGRLELKAAHYAAARQQFEAAYRELKGRKLSLVIGGLRVCPPLVRWLVNRRDQYAGTV